MSGQPVADRELHERLRKRILMFYFAAGLNLVMALWVLSVATTQVASGTIMIVLAIFLVFAGLNFYMARQLRRQWNEHLRKQQGANPPQPGE